jgi:hypothetical protein
MRNWINLFENYAPEAFFWFNANKTECHMFGDEDIDHAVFASDKFGETEVDSEDFWVWNSAQIDTAIKNNWVRGRFNQGSGQLSLQGNRRSLSKAAKWFCAKYPVDVLFVDFGEGEDSFHSLDERKSISLRGDRLAFFLSKGSIPSAMVMEHEFHEARAFTMPLAEVIIDQLSVKGVMRDIIKGQLSHSVGQPIELTTDTDGLRIGDGAHRMIQAVLLGKKSLKAILNPRYATEFGIPMDRRWTPAMGFEMFGYSVEEIEHAREIVKNNS